MFKKHYTKKRSAAESRFYGITSRLRQNRELSKEQQKDAAHIIHKIQQYGFDFFPNHYLWEDLNTLESIANAN